MQYAYEVKHDGVYYPAGADVPDGMEDKGAEVDGAEAPAEAPADELGDIAPADEQEKPKKSKKN